jgi:isopenicillin N synthase-like dioxygenase
MIDHGRATSAVAPDKASLPLLTQIREVGFARIQLDQEQARLLAALYDQTMVFSRRDSARKALHQSPKLNNGYRPLGAAHAGDPGAVDFNDSFLFWGERSGDSIPESGLIRPLLTALEDYRRDVCVVLMSRLVAELCEHYGKGEESVSTLPFEATSVLQFNSFHTPTERELLQTRHEDGVVATVIWTSAPGLEIFHNDMVMPLTPAPDEVFIMPGGILAAMTGGEIPPLFHQARNQRFSSPGAYDAERKSIMYFSNFDPSDRTIEPFVRNENNRDTDIGAMILESPDMFGLPDHFYERA